MTRAIDGTGARSEWREGWPTVLWTTGAIASGIGLLTITASYFVKPLATATGWSRADIAFGTTLAQFCLAAILPFIGAMADRTGIRRVAITSAVVYGGLCLAMAVVPATLPVYYTMLVLLALTASGTSTVVLAQLVAERFQRWRGTVLGIAISGPAILLIPLAPLMVMATNEISWRAGYLILGVISLVVGLPSIVLAVRGRPSKAVAPVNTHVQLADGASNEGLSLGQAFRTVDYWMLIAASLISTLPLGGFLHQLSALLSDKGLSVGAIGWLASVFVTMIFVGRSGAGLMLDMLSPAFTVILVMFGAAAGALILLVPDTSILVLTLAVGLIGSAMGSEGSIQGYFIARTFGMKSFSAIFGTFGTCTVLGFGAGALIFGKLYDLKGDYDLVMILCAAAFAIAGALFGGVGARRPKIAAASKLPLAEVD